MLVDGQQNYARTHNAETCSGRSKRPHVFQKSSAAKPALPLDLTSLAVRAKNQALPMVHIGAGHDLASDVQKKNFLPAPACARR